VHPGQDDMRRHPPVRNGDSMAFALLNRGKQSLVLDLKNRDDQARLTPLIARADIQRQANLAANITQVTGTLTNSLQTFRMP